MASLDYRVSRQSDAQIRRALGARFVEWEGTVSLGSDLFING